MACTHYLFVKTSDQESHIGGMLITKLLECYKNYVYIKIMPLNPMVKLCYQRYGFQIYSNNCTIKLKNRGEVIMMRGWILLIPFILIRFGLLAYVNKEAIQKAAHFPAMAGNEFIAYIIYQLSNVAIFLYLCVLQLSLDSSWVMYVGGLLYALGLILMSISIVDFARSDEQSLIQRGSYRYSRNPMYISYFVCFIGCAALTQSWILLGFIIIFQVSAHWIILAEERWCLKKFQEKYQI